MDSYFHPTIRPPSLRQAERTDTRQAIRRQENKDGRRKKNRRSLEDIDSDDETVVSVESLRVFLLSLLEQGQSEQSATDRSSYAVPETQQSKAGAPSAKPPMAARAAQAYQSAYNASHPTEREQADAAAGGQRHDSDEYRDTADAYPSAPPAQKSLSDKDRDVVTDLIEDLDFLMSHKIQELAIRRKGDLLQSIISTVNAHKTLLKSK